MRRSSYRYAALALVTASTTAFFGCQFVGPALASQTARTAGAIGAAKPNVLLVCNGSTKPCPPTSSKTYKTVQSAVNAAHRGDWILIWPGVYHENTPKWQAGVWVGTPDLHIRGLDRNGVIIDGSKGTAAHPCPSSPALQNYAPRNGILVAASGVSVENLTVCNYLGLNGNNGNEIWWNGGDGSGKIGIAGYRGAYLSATATFNPPFTKPKPGKPVSPHFAQYGIFVSNATGPGMITRSYASNMADAAYYVGACQRVCDTVLSRDIGTNSALGYSGTNAGGHLVIKDSLFFENRTGLAPNSLNNSDAPPPQDGRCPNSTTKSCMFIEHNLIINNNNPNVPLFGITPAIGAGIELSGGMYDTVRGNVIKDQGSWGVVTHDYPDPETPPKGSHCQGGFPNQPLTNWCDFPARGSLIFGNAFVHVGFFGNPANVDLATIGLLPQSATPRNCFYGNVAFSNGQRVGVTSSPANIERSSVDGPSCGRRGTGLVAALLNQLVCATGGQVLPCTDPHAHYPKQTKLVVVPLPVLPSMPDVCSGVPANPFCER